MRDESRGNAAETGVVDPLGDEERSAPEDELEALAEEFGDKSLDELEELEEPEDLEDLEELQEVEALEEEEELEAAEYRSALLHPDRPPAGDQEEEDEEEAALEDAETALDELLAEQWGGEPVFGPAMPSEEEAEEEEALARAIRTNRDVGIPQRQPDEFVCRSCFLVKHVRLLADDERQICCDCAA